MGDFVEELLVRLGIDIDRASIEAAIRAMRDAERGADDAGDGLDDLGESADDVGVNFKGMATVILGASAAISGALGAMVMSYATAGSEIENLSKLANTNTDTLQRNAAAARTVGIETEELAQIYKDMGDRVGDFIQTGGGPMADFFENIGPKVGVTAEMFRDLSGPDALQLFASSLEEANLSQSEMTFFLESMAGDLTKLQPLLANGGAEMKRLGDEIAATGAIIDEEGIKTAQALSTEMSMAGMTIEGLRNTIAQELAPTVLEIIKSFRAFIAENRELISLGIVRLFDAARFALKALSVAAAGFLAYKLGVAIMGIGQAIIFLRNAFTMARIAALLFNASVLLIPILIGAAVIGMGLLIEDLFTFLQGGESYIGDLVAAFPQLEGVIRGVAGFMGDLWSQAKLVWELLKAIFTGDFAGAGDIFQQLVTNAADILTGLIDVFSGVGQQAVDALAGKFPAIAAAATLVVGNITDIFKGFVGVIKGLFTGDWTGAMDAFDSIVSRWKTAVLGFVKFVPDAVGGLLKKIGGWIGLGGEDEGSESDSGGFVGAALSSESFPTPPPMTSSNFGGVAASAGVTNSSSRSTTVQQTDARVFNINGADTGMVKKILREDNAYAAKSIDTGYDY